MKKLICIFSVCSVLLSGGCLKKKDINDRKNKDVLSNVITFEISDTVGIIADGKYKIKLSATLPKYQDAGEAFKKVTFQTTTGILDGETTGKKEVAADANGVATAFMTMGTTHGPFYVSVMTGGLPQYRIEKQLVARKVADSSALDFTISDTAEVKADNFKLFKVVAKATKIGEKSVKFFVNEGTIQGIGNQKDRVVLIDQNGKAEILVRTDVNVKTYIVGVETSSISPPQKSFGVRRAYADSMLIEPSKLVIDTVAPITIKVHLFRAAGKVSLETPVFFESYQIDNSNNEKPVGRFTGLAGSFSNSESDVTVGFVADTGNLISGKPIYIRVKTRRDNGSYNIKVVRFSVK